MLGGYLAVLVCSFGIKIAVTKMEAPGVGRSAIGRVGVGGVGTGFTGQHNNVNLT